MMLKSPCITTFIKRRLQLQCLFYQQKHSEQKYPLNISPQTSFEEHHVYPLRGSVSQATPFPQLEGRGTRTGKGGDCPLGPGWQQPPLLCAMGQVMCRLCAQPSPHLAMLSSCSLEQEP